MLYYGILIYQLSQVPCESLCQFEWISIEMYYSHLLLTLLLPQLPHTLTPCIAWSPLPANKGLQCTYRLTDQDVLPHTAKKIILLFTTTLLPALFGDWDCCFTILEVPLVYMRWTSPAGPWLGENRALAATTIVFFSTLGYWPPFSIQFQTS